MAHASTGCFSRGVLGYVCSVYLSPVHEASKMPYKNKYHHVLMFGGLLNQSAAYDQNSLV